MTKNTQCVCGRHSHLVGAETLGQKLIDGATNGASVAQVAAPLLVAAGLLSAPALLAEGTQCCFRSDSCMQPSNQ